MKFLPLQALCGATLVAALPGLYREVANDLDKEVADVVAPLMSILGMGDKLVSLEDALKQYENAPKAKSDAAQYGDVATTQEKTMASQSSAADTCAANPSVRYEWDNYTTANRQALMNAFQCMMSLEPSGKFEDSTSRWEDFVSLHQMYTPTVHQNQLFLPWHRYLINSFEQAMRQECNFTAPMAWFDETKHSGAFENSDLFSAKYLGSLRNGVNYCVSDGQFAGLKVNVGPGSGNTPHCLSRNGNADDTAQCSTNYVKACMQNSRYQDFEKCFEYGPHGYGHNGIGGVMADVYASPADPFFWFHHGFVDRAWRVWEVADPTNRYSSIDGTDINGNPISLDTVISMNGASPDIKIRQVMNTLSGEPLCYRYDY
ncbi:hypothetical protein GGS21DRAFT_479006 [Xylaria nigripes]|nr:hypothetical protein GGS21DRAFT_479006 [Xylaria nigripes]